MAKLQFDQDGQRFYENGVDHGILFVMKENGEYDKGVAWNGLTSVSQSPEGAEAEDVYADNMKYLTLVSAETFGATINAYTYPDAFKACDGQLSANGINVGQQTRTKFAFAYRTNVGNDQGVERHKIHIVYGCTASPSEREYSTVNDSPEALEMSWEISTVGTATNKKLSGKAIKPISYVEIEEYKFDSTTGTYVENTTYATIESTLLGTDAAGQVEGTDPTLVTVDQILTYMGAE